RPPSGGASHAARAANRCVTSDRTRSRWRTAAKQTHDLSGHSFLQFKIFVCAPLCVAFATSEPRVVVGEALLLGTLECFLVDHDPLAPIPLTRPAEAHDHGR